MDDDVEAMAANALKALDKAVAKELDRKRRLGQYAVMMIDGEIVRVPPEELPVLEDYDPTSESSRIRNRLRHY